MVVDASAILAILFDEPERGGLTDFLTTAESLVMTPVNRWEVLARAETARGAAGRLQADRIMAGFGIEVVQATADLADKAVDAAARYRGRPARLNLGDCFAYALATTRGEPLLFKGEDFTHTDVVAASY